MRTFSGKRKYAGAGYCRRHRAMSGWVVAPQASAAGFIDDSTFNRRPITGSSVSA